jgi:hypothetical protein
MPNKIDETLNDVKRLSFKKGGSIFIFVSFASLSVRMLQSKKGNGFLSSHHCLENSPWSRVLKQYPIGALPWLRLPENRAYTKQDKQFQRNTYPVIKIDYTIMSEHFGFPWMRQMVYARC